MIYFMQIIRMLNKKQRKLFIELFDDLSDTIEECGYDGIEDELINMLMIDHLGLEIECSKQLDYFTDYIMKNQGQIATKVKGTELYMGMR